jgi:hypothetical protein
MKCPEVSANVERQLKALREGPKPLTAKQIAALSGIAYRAFAEGLEDNPGLTAKGWHRVAEANEVARRGNPLVIAKNDAERQAISMEGRFGPLADATLLAEGTVTDDESRWKLIEALARDLTPAARKLARNADGDYSPDTYAARFPSPTEAKPSAQAGRKAVLPDERAAPYLKPVATLHVISEAIRGKLGPVDISAVSAKIEALLDEKIEGVAITAPIIEGDEAGGRVDLSAIDFDKLAKLFSSRPRTAAEQLRSEVETKAHDMAEQNPTRVHLVEKLEKLVEAYNLGTVQVEAFFEALKALAAEMDEEERRAARENLSQDELAIFDLLTKPEPNLTKAQELEVKRVARDLLEKLQEQLAIADWRSKQQTRAAVETTIRFTLNELPEEPYPEPVWNEKVDAVWAFIFARRQAHASRSQGWQSS